MEISEVFVKSWQGCEPKSDMEAEHVFRLTDMRKTDGIAASTIKSKDDDQFLSVWMDVGPNPLGEPGTTPCAHFYTSEGGDVLFSAFLSKDGNIVLRLNDFVSLKSVTLPDSPKDAAFIVG